MSDLSHRDPQGPQPRAARSTDTNRRRFLMLGAGAATAAAAPVLAAPAALVDAPKTTAESRGYQETQHVRDYYATTRI
jgi:hypothetical protein